MKKLHFRYLLVICLGFLVGVMPAILNLFVDPYELLFERGRTGEVAELAEKAHYPLWKLGKYKYGEYETIVLGDSRARALREKYWNSLGFSSVKNLAYGGGTIPEIYETYKLIKNDPAVKNLVIGIQLRSFDEDHKQGMNRVPEAASLISNPVEYLFNWSVAKTSFRVAEHEYPFFWELMNLNLLLTSKAEAADYSALLETTASEPSAKRLTPEHSDFQVRKLPEKFARQVSRNARSDWKGFQVSERYWKFIEEIGQWAKSEGKSLVFVIPPTISEMQRTISNYGHNQLDAELRNRLTKHGIVLDFDYPDQLTENLENFTDAYHFNAYVARQIVGEVVAQLSIDDQISLRVEKRRKLIRCPEVSAPQQSIRVDESVSLATGSNCRLWSKAVE